MHHPTPSVPSTATATATQRRGHRIAAAVLATAIGGVGVIGATLPAGAAGATCGDLPGSGYAGDPGRIGNLVFRDLDDDGRFDEGESGLSGVGLELWSDVDGDGTFEPDGDDSTGLLCSTVTDADGHYWFRQVPEGQHFVAVVSGVPADLTTSTIETSDSVTDNRDKGRSTSGFDAVSMVFAVTTGSAPTGEAGTGLPAGTDENEADAMGSPADDDSSNLTIDFGFAPSAVSVDPTPTIAPASPTTAPTTTPAPSTTTPPTTPTTTPSTTTSTNPSTTLTIAEVRDVAVDMSGSEANGEVTWTITVSNLAETMVPAGELELIDTLSDGIDLRSFSAAGMDCTADAAAGTLRCVSTVDLAPGGELTATVVTSAVTTGACATTNSVEVISTTGGSGMPVETSLADNSATAEVSGACAEGATRNRSALPITGASALALGLLAVIVVAAGFQMQRTSGRLRRDELAERLGS